MRENKIFFPPEPTTTWFCLLFLDIWFCLRFLDFVAFLVDDDRAGKFYQRPSTIRPAKITKFSSGSEKL